MKHSPSSLMRFFVSPYEASMYKYLKEVDPDAAQEDPEDPFMQVASRKGDIHEEKLFNDLRDEVDTSIVIVNSDPEDMFADGGRIGLEGGTNEGFINVNINLEEVIKARNRIPNLINEKPFSF